MPSRAPEIADFKALFARQKGRFVFGEAFSEEGHALLSGPESSVTGPLTSETKEWFLNLPEVKAVLPADANMIGGFSYWRVFSPRNFRSFRVVVHWVDPNATSGLDILHNNRCLGWLFYGKG